MNRRVAFSLAAFLAVSAVPAAAHRSVAGTTVRQFRISGMEWGPFVKAYENNGYSLSVQREIDGELLVTVTASAQPIESRLRFPLPRDIVEAMPGEALEGLESLGVPAAAGLAAKLTKRARSQHEAVQEILLWVAENVRYELDLERQQNAAAVLERGSASCVGFANVAVSLLRSAGIPARTVFGIVAGDPAAADAAVPYSGRLGGVLHRWIEVYYPDAGWIYSDPLASLHFVDARYVRLDADVANARLPPRAAMRSVWWNGDFVTVTRDARRNQDGVKECRVRQNRYAAAAQAANRTGQPTFREVPAAREIPR